MKDVIEIGKSKGKKILVCITGNEDENVLVDKKKIQDYFLYYKIDEMNETDIGKILQAETTPVYLFVDGDSVVSLLETKDLNNNMDTVFYVRENNYKEDEKVKYINAVLKLCDYLENDSLVLSEELSCLDSLVRKENLFYGKYILAQVYRNIDKDKAYRLYKDLWVNSTSEDIKFYPDEFMEVMKEKDCIIRIKKDDIQFDYTLFDYGDLRPNEEKECKFYFTNRGNVDFVIYSVVSTCGCTIPFWNRRPLRPGERDSISVRLKVNRKGNLQKMITIKGNTDQIIKLRVKASVH